MDLYRGAGWRLLGRGPPVRQLQQWHLGGGAGAQLEQFRWECQLEHRRRRFLSKKWNIDQNVSLLPTPLDVGTRLNRHY